MRGISKVCVSMSWNQKKLDYEIETDIGTQQRVHRHDAWNQKKLDYEIETSTRYAWSLYRLNLKPKETRLRDWNAEAVQDIPEAIADLETKRNSITRLKRQIGDLCQPRKTNLETKRNSITRLKLRFIRIRHQHHNILETKRNSITRLKRSRGRTDPAQSHSILKPKETRLRDWNWLCNTHHAVLSTLKPKETRLRDWNLSHSSVWCSLHSGLETKRNSITRLKLPT